MSEMTLSLLVLLGTVVLFLSNRLPVALVAVLSALALYATGVIDTATVVSGFGDPILVFIACLFIVAEGLDASGLTTWAGQLLVRHAGGSRAGLLLGVGGLAALMAAFVTPNGAAASLVPVTVIAARRAGLVASPLLMPVAFSASAGALLMLSGSTVNVIVSDALTDVTGTGFGFFEFGLIGLPLVLTTLLVCLLGADRLVPHREPESPAADLSGHVAELVRRYSLDRGFYRVRVPAGSDLVGQDPQALAAIDEVVVLGAQCADGETREPGTPTSADDSVVLAGPAEAVTRLVARYELDVVAEPLTQATPQALLNDELGIAEVVVPTRSRLVGERVFPGLTRSGLTLLTVARFGRNRGSHSIELQPGDMMLLHGPWRAVAQLARDADVLPVSDPEVVRRQNAPLGIRAWFALGALAITVALLASGATAPATGALVGATLMVLTRVITPAQAFSAVSWQTLALIGGLIPLSVAISTSGAAELVASGIVGLVAGGGPLLLLAALFVMTVALGQFISNTATLLIVAPIALAAGAAAGVAPAPVLMMVAVAGCATFLTPIGTAANMIVMGAAGFRFGDYLKLGLVLTLAWFVVAITLVPLIWGT